MPSDRHHQPVPPFMPDQAGEPDPDATGHSLALDQAAIARLRADMEIAEAFAARSRAANTVATYNSCWARYLIWCDARSVPPLSGRPEAVAVYLGQAGLTLSPSTLRTHLAAIASRHREAGVPLDTKHRAIAQVMGGVARTKGTKPTRQAAPILRWHLQAMMTRLPDSPLGIRDRALILLGYGGAMRRSEIAALDLADVRIEDRGIRVEFGATKTDQEGRGEVIAIYGSQKAELDAAAALSAWLRIRGDAPGPLFQGLGRSSRPDGARLTGKAVERIVRGAVARSGLPIDPGDYSGHSLRAGIATQAAMDGYSLTDIMKQTRHRDVNTVRRYVRDAEIWQRNISEGAFG